MSPRNAHYLRGSTMPRTTDTAQLRPPRRLFELEVLKGAWNDGEAHGRRQGFQQAFRWAWVCGAGAGFCLGAVARHFLGPLS